MTWDACTLEPNSILRWMECHPGFSGYVQAFGVIFSVAGALFWRPAMGVFDRWKANRDLVRRTNGMAIVLGSYVSAIEARTRELVVKFEEGGLPVEIGPLDLAVPIAAPLDPVNRPSQADVNLSRLQFIFDLVDRVMVYNTKLPLQRVTVDRLPPQFAAQVRDELQSLWEQSVDVINRIDDIA